MNQWERVDAVITQWDRDGAVITQCERVGDVMTKWERVGAIMIQWTTLCPLESWTSPVARNQIRTNGLLVAKSAIMDFS